MIRYVKEFVHGDFGRTKPSLGTLLHMETDILELDVEVDKLLSCLHFMCLLLFQPLEHGYRDQGLNNCGKSATYNCRAIVLFLVR